MDIYKTILNTINKNKMTKPGMHVIAAVSGGADSVCLLLALKELSAELGITLEAFHLHHGLRGEEADRDADFVEDICKKWKIPITIRREKVREYSRENGLSLEEAGRILRYRAMEELKAEAESRLGEKTAAAVAHHMGDSEETILHNLFRGTGLKGLRGIPPVRDGIIRPLIELSRRDIEDFLVSRGIPWCEDSTNGDNDYTRNKIRNKVLPMVREEINREADAHILQAGKLIAMADDFLEKKAEDLWDEWGNMEAGGRTVFPTASFPVSVIAEQEEIIRYYLIRRMVTTINGSVKNFTFSHVEAVEQLLWGQTGKQVDLPGKLQARREYGRLVVEKNGKLGENNNLLQDSGIKDECGERMEFKVFSNKKGMEIPKNQYTKWFDYDKMKGALCLRFREPGDYMTLAGGGRKSIKSFMIDEKIPRDRRGKIPVLADGKHIVWIVGYRISEYYKVTEDTRTVIEARFGEGGQNGR